MPRKIKLNQDNYYSTEADRYYFSVSQYKDFMKCEAMALAKIRGEYRPQMTRAMLTGSFVDSYFEGTLDAFMKEHPEVFTRRQELRSEFRKANEIISRLQEDETFMRFMSGEKQRIMTFELFGFPWKMKMDSYIPGICITDLKVVQRFRTLPLWRYTAKAPEIHKNKFSDTYKCPNCNLAFIHKDTTGWFCGKQYKFCPDCGQRLTWEE